MIHAGISERASATPGKIAIVQGTRRVSYAELDLHISRIAAFFVENGLLKGDRVGILCENSPEYVIAYFGVQKAGGIAVDLNPQYSAREARTVIEHCAPVAVIVESKYAEIVEQGIAHAQSVRMLISIERGAVQEPASEAGRDSCNSLTRISFTAILEQESAPCVLPTLMPQDPAAIIYTSGTTGAPKGVLLSHDNFTSNADSVNQYLGLTANDSVMVILPFCYSYGKSLLTTHMAAGGSMVLENSFLYPDIVLKKMIDEGVTGFSGVPSTFAILLNRSAIRKYQFPKLRYVTQAGGPMSPQHALELQKVLLDTSIYIMYGQTEASPRLTYLEPGEVVRKSGSIGKAIPGVTIELIKEGGETAQPGEEGELVASGRNIMMGYWNNPGETQKVLRNNKLYTGDMATMDEEGYLYIVGRRSDMIKSGAHRISPKEIEEAILELDGVHEVAVVGAEDAILGQVVKAFVALKEGRTLTGQEVQRHCQTRLAAFKIPKEVTFVAELPKTNSGKVQRHVLKQTPRNMPSILAGKDAASNL